VLHKFRKLFDILYETHKVASREGLMRYAGALAFFAIFCVAPFLTIILGVAGIWLSRRSVDQKFEAVLADSIGPEAGQFIQNLLQDAATQGAYAIALAVITLIFLAMRVVLVVQTGLNAMSGLPNPEPENFVDTIRQNAFRAFVIIIFQVAAIFVLLLSAVFNNINEATKEQLPLVFPTWVEALLHYGLAYGLLSGVIAATYAYLPAKQMRFKTVLPGAFVAAVSFLVLNTLFGIYISFSNYSRIFGAATALIFVLLWFYFAAQIFLYGAALNHSLNTRTSRKLWNGDSESTEVAAASAEG
jgi:membrane protein